MNFITHWLNRGLRKSLQSFRYSRGSQNTSALDRCCNSRKCPAKIQEFISARVSSSSLSSSWKRRTEEGTPLVVKVLMTAVIAHFYSGGVAVPHFLGMPGSGTMQVQITIVAQSWPQMKRPRADLNKHSHWSWKWPSTPALKISFVLTRQ